LYAEPAVIPRPVAVSRRFAGAGALTLAAGRRPIRGELLVEVVLRGRVAGVDLVDAGKAAAA